MNKVSGDSQKYKFGKKKKNLYYWMGNPQDPYSLYTELSNYYDYNYEDFYGNCEVIKKIISQIVPPTQLKQYKKYLEYRNKSTHMDLLMKVAIPFFLAIITAAVISMLSFLDKNPSMINYLNNFGVLVIGFIGLKRVISFNTFEENRNRLLLLIISELIEEDEEKRLKSNSLY
ncbi:hypothetical protein QUF84_09125 [Fictibacillus enclensis]|uniref:hypothetical protein n=1 Tax=Fictibacillus enclensis TaxID=1017270 RepID=UPI0025A03E1C|nr:hypothetical protein [Fictibacillus enclensis]MDM5337375.1 hypothetical protein [Fictibacillus enclensis]